MKITKSTLQARKFFRLTCILLGSTRSHTLCDTWHQWLSCRFALAGRSSSCSTEPHLSPPLQPAVSGMLRPESFLFGPFSCKIDFGPTDLEQISYRTRWPRLWRPSFKPSFMGKCKPGRENLFSSLDVKPKLTTKSEHITLFLVFLMPIFGDTCYIKVLENLFTFQ